MNYTTYLKSKKLSKNTIKTYEMNLTKFLEYLNDRKITKNIVVKWINIYEQNHSINSTKLMYQSIVSYLKFKKEHKLLQELKDIRLGCDFVINRTIISLDEFLRVREQIKLNDWKFKRNWLIFSVLFCTGIRISELKQFQKINIKDNQIIIFGKGSKRRQVFIPKYIQDLLLEWKPNKLSISTTYKELSYRQLNQIVKKIGMEYFNKEITPHSLRRSYASNLLQKNIDLKTISLMLGHNSITTTSRYIFITNDEITNKICSIF